MNIVTLVLNDPVLSGLYYGSIFTSHKTQSSALTRCHFYSTASSQGREQLRSTVHLREDRPDPDGQTLHDEPRPERVRRILLPQPGVRAARLKIWREFLKRRLDLDKKLF